MKIDFNFSSKVIAKHPGIWDVYIKGQMISKGPLVSSYSPKNQMNEFVFTRNWFARFLGDFEDTKNFFQNYLTFKKEI